MSAVTATAATSSSRQRTFGDWFRTVLRAIGQVLISLGVVILLFVVYELYWTNLDGEHHQSQLLGTIKREFVQEQTTSPGGGRPSAQKISSIPVGDGIGVLYIPRFGSNYHEVIVEGTGFSQLQEGPGHYLGTAYPGQVGNFYVAGHRTTYAAPFNRLAELRDGDLIYIETVTHWYTYKLEDIPGTNAKWQEIVAPTDLSISYPVPDQPDPSLAPTKRVLTFSTCNPEYSATQRLIVHGLLIAKHKRVAGYSPSAVVNAV